MFSEIGNSPPAGMPVAAAQAMATKRPEQTPDDAAPKVQAPKAVELHAPKPIDIKFDPVQAHQNLQEAVSMLNEQMTATKQGLGFSYDNSKNQAVIRVSNTATGELIRQIPSEDVLRMAHHIDEMKGILYNKAV